MNAIKIYLLEWKHLICAEFCTDTHTWLLCTAILVIGLISDEICSWFSIWSVALFITLIVPCTEHHSFPFTFSSLDIGLVTEPSRTICGDVTHHAPTEFLIKIQWNIEKLQIWTKIEQKRGNSLNLLESLEKMTSSPLANDTNTRFSTCLNKNEWNKCENPLKYSQQSPNSFEILTISNKSLSIIEF